MHSSLSASIIEASFVISSREVVSTLTQFGVEPTGDFAMVKTVHEEVKKLCNRRDIADAIVNQDVEKELEKNKRKFLIFDDEEASLKVGNI